MPFQTLLNIKFASVRAKLALLVIVGVLPIALVAISLVISYFQHERQQAMETTITRARAMVSALDREFANSESALLALSTSPYLITKDLRNFHDQAMLELTHIDANSIVVLDASGQMLLSTHRTFGEPLPKLDKTPLLTRILATGEPGVSDVFRGPLGGIPIVTIAVPVYINGVMTGSLNAAIEPDRFAAILTEQKLPAAWRATIADSSGNIIARSQETASFGKTMPPNVLQHLDQANEGAFETTSLGDAPTLTAYSRSPLHHWTVVLETPMAEMTANARHTLGWLLVATFFALAVGLITAWKIGGRIAQCITSLVPPAQALGFGDAVSVPSMYFSEADELGRALVGAAAALQRAKYDSLHDSLTGLANRTLFNTMVDQQIALCLRNKIRLAILYLDLDGFKAVNDTHGHATGDDLLRVVTGRIKSAIRDSDLAARLGGDEFGIALIHADAASAARLAEKLIADLSAPYRLGFVEAHISASIGIAAYPESAQDGITLIKHADKAMYQAKSNGKHRVCIYADAEAEEIGLKRRRF